MNRVYVALDLEFTGLDPQRDEIIEIGLVRFRGDEVEETFSSLVKAHRPVPFKIQQLVGISQEKVTQAPTLQSLTGKILSFVKSYPIVGHTVEMDMQFMNRQGLLLQNLAIDTFELASILVPEVQRYGLANLASFLGIAVSASHRALPDAMATKDLFLALVARAYEWDLDILEEIVQLSANANWPLRQVFRDVATERRGSSLRLLGRDEKKAPLRVAPEQGDSSPLEPTEAITPLDGETLAAMISPKGLVARAFSGYEHRPQQVEMLHAVVEAMNTPSHLMVEAGTGTGKSLAYLLPAAYFAAQNGRRVVISSNTINLQDQLYTKDIPDLKRILPLDFRAALLKGRNNYLCLRRLAIFRRIVQLDMEGVRVLAKVLAWLPTTDAGDRSELVLINNEGAIWSQIQSSSETCLGDQCHFCRTGQCFFYRARARAERAHLLIVNHALLLSDLVLENRILPEYKYLIIDEAHHLEEQATNQFGIEVSQRDVYAFLNGISHQGNDAPAGLLADVPALYQKHGVSSTAQQTMTDTIQRLRTDVDVTERRLYELFNALSAFLDEHSELRQSSQDLYDQNITLTNGLRAQPDWLQVETAWESFSTTLQQGMRNLERLIEQVTGLSLGEDSERDEIVQNLKAQLQLGQQTLEGMNSILLEPNAEGIYWISIAKYHQEITLHSAPLHVGPLLAERLFANNECVILTSATLRTANSFDFMKERLGLEDSMDVALDSPFDFKTAVLLYVPKDIPEPNQPYYQKTIEKALVDLCRATEGRTLILFTSNSQLQATYRAIQRPLEEDGIVLFGQGMDGSRRQILENFVSTPRAVLLGTRSFWEGVDVVGQALSCLVIARLPFAVPTDPVCSARAGTFDDPFNQYYLPDSILRFRQGFGRLIRSKEDYGLVVVLDKRILTKSYGKTILRSLPPCTARQGPLESLPSLAQRWLDVENHKRLAVGDA